MINFGFELQKEHIIDLDLADLSYYHKLNFIEPSVKLCISCGTCSATCTANVHSYTNFRRAILLMQRGENVSARKEIESCMLCGKCTLICPRGVSTRNVIHTMLRILTKE